MLTSQCQHRGDTGGSCVDGDVMGRVAACHKSAVAKMHTIHICSAYLS